MECCNQSGRESGTATWHAQRGEQRHVDSIGGGVAPRLSAAASAEPQDLRARGVHERESGNLIQALDLLANLLSKQLLLDLLDTSLPPPIQAATLATLTSALLSSPHNARVFEATDGLLTITSLYKSRNTTPPVRQSLQEFLYFYLLPEAPLGKSVQSEPNTAVWRRGDDNAARGGMQGRRADTVADSAAWGAEGDGIGWGHLPEADGGVVKLRLPDEKRKLLGRYLRDADGLAQDFKDAPPFPVADRGGGLIVVE